MEKENRKNPVIIKIPQGEEKNAANLVVYVVNKQGKVTESHSLKSGEARLTASAEDLHANKLYVAPEAPKEAGKVTLTETILQQMGAWQPAFRLPSDNIFRLPYLPPFPYPFPFGWCNITGTVHKTFNVNGQPEVLDICNARVHICAITPIRLIIPKIPINILKDLRDRLVAVIKKPIPIPDPGPEKQIFTRSLKRSIAPRNNFFELADVHELVEKLPNRPTLPENIQNSILSGSMESFSKTIANNFNLFHPYLCWWPWFWPYYKSDPIATVVTDCHGRFNYKMLYFLANHPNVYVWVEVLINGVWTTVYKPAISCHTYWNYACGTDINISVTNPAVRPCFCDSPTIEANYVWVKSVNRGVSVRSIQQQATPSGHLANAVGLTAYGNKGNISPFGGGFSLVLQFGDGLAGFGVTHYRWNCQLLKDAYLGNNVGSPEILGGNVAKAYSHWIQVAPGDWEHVPGSFPLGPYLDSAGKVMYKIPHTHANVDTGLADAVWDTGIDTDTININTVGWTPGLYQFTIELLNNNGQIVPLNYNPFKVNRIAADGAPTGVDTIDADLAGGGYVRRNAITHYITGFHFLMRVDNNYCYAGIADALVDGHSTDTECGTGYYDDKFNDKVELMFQAGHPHNFATYDFNTYKGNSGALAVAASAGTSANANNALNVTAGDNGYDITQVTFAPAPPPPAVQNPVNRIANMDQYHKAIGVSDMLGTCTMAAFSENLNVYATHTNGNDRLSQYDAHYIAAIAVAPKS